MFHQQPATILRRRSKVIVLSGILVAAMCFFATLLLPLEYRADAQVFISSQSRYGVDPYTVVKSSERIGENLTQIMKTNDFYQKVISQPGYQLDTTRFQNIEERIKRKRWEKTISSSVVFGTGVLNVSAYHKNQQQAQAFASAAVDALVQQGKEYVGTDVTMKVVNYPVVTQFPVRPNIIVNTLLGFFVGVVGMGVLVLRKKRGLV